MGQSVPDLEELISEFRVMLPAQSRTAQAIDQRDPFDEIAHKAIDEMWHSMRTMYARLQELELAWNELAPAVASDA